MYNGIGLNTPRGSGTNGFVQRNFAQVRHRREKVEYKTEADLEKLERELHKKPNRDILEHEWKRKIELECLTMQEKLEEQGWAECGRKWAEGGGSGRREAGVGGGGFRDTCAMPVVRVGLDRVWVCGKGTFDSNYSPPLHLLRALSVGQDW